MPDVNYWNDYYAKRPDLAQGSLWMPGQGYDISLPWDATRQSALGAPMPNEGDPDPLYWVSDPQLGYIPLSQAPTDKTYGVHWGAEGGDSAPIGFRRANAAPNSKLNQWEGAPQWFGKLGGTTEQWDALSVPQQMALIDQYAPVQNESALQSIGGFMTAGHGILAPFLGGLLGAGSGLFPDLFPGGILGDALGEGAGAGLDALTGAAGGLEEAAPGWVSAEGGSGYINGLAADSAALSDAAIGAGSDWANGVPGSQFTNGVDTIGSDWANGLPGTDNPGLASGSGSVLDNFNLKDLSKIPVPPGSNGGENAGSDWSNGVPGSQVANGGSPLSGVPSAASTAGTALTRTIEALKNGQTPALSDLLSLGGTAGTTLLQMFNDSNKSDANQALADRYAAYGAPSRARYEASFAPGFKANDIPGYQQALDTSWETGLRKGSIGGNPVNNPGVLSEINKYVVGSTALPAIQQYQNQNAATGGYGAYSTAAPQVAQNAINSSGNYLTDLGGGLAQLLNPRPSTDQTLANLLNSFKGFLSPA